MQAAVIIFPGSNCDRDIWTALSASMGHEALKVWHGDADLPKVDFIALPGGFSYGDYLRAGAMAAHSPIMREVVKRAKAGVPVLGICNGFQVLTESHLLPGALIRNRDLKFVCKDVHMRVEDDASLFTSGYDKGDIVRFPVAHHDGNYFADHETLRMLEDDGRIALRYSDATGEITDDANPNGAAHNIAGIFNEDHTVMGLMPHPERLADPVLGGRDGRAMFDGIVEALS